MESLSNCFSRLNGLAPWRGSNRMLISVLKLMMTATMWQWVYTVERRLVRSTHAN